MSETAATPVLRFDGGDGRVELAGKLPLHGDAVTVEFWARIDAAAGAQTVAFLAAGAEDQLALLVHLPYRQRIYWQAWDDNRARVQRAVSTELLSRWCHWAFVKDTAAGELSIYLDGEPWASGSDCGGPFAPIERIVLGNYHLKPRPWKGALAELRVWNTARTAARIRQSMHSRCSGSEMGLVGYWPLNEGDGEAVRDRTTSGMHGSLQGTANWEVAELPLRERAVAATGLEDYAYWYRWMKMQEKQPREPEPAPFRRGRIWS
ncbi:LamG-like jellyroll fold domain-containing protein [Endothiovibrio diazotrophicus]